MENVAMESTAVVDKPKTASWTGKLEEGIDFLEQPVIAASAIDCFVENQPGTQKLRRELIREFNWPGNMAYLGRWGRVSLNHTALLECLAASQGSSRKRAFELGELYNRAGLAELVKSGKFANVLNVVDESVRQRVAVPNQMDPARLLNETLKDLVVSNAEVREVAVQMTAITKKVDTELSQVRRHFAYVERIEGDEALSVVTAGDRQELRIVDTKMLRAVGVEASKDVFILYEFQWSPGKVASVCVPAVLLRSAERQAEIKRQEAELLEYETPLRKRTRTAKIEAQTYQSSAAPLRNTAKS
jgi:hypothetical protein